MEARVAGIVAAARAFHDGQAARAPEPEQAGAEDVPANEADDDG